MVFAIERLIPLPTKMAEKQWNPREMGKLESHLSLSSAIQLLYDTVLPKFFEEEIFCRIIGSNSLEIKFCGLLDYSMEHVLQDKFRGKIFAVGDKTTKLVIIFPLEKFRLYGK